MPIIPIPDGLRRVARDSFDESEAARYRAEADAKLKRLQDTPMAQLGPDEPLKGDFKRPAWMGSRGYDTPDFTSSAEPTIVPAEGDQSRDLSELGLSPRFSEDLSQPAAPESDVPGVGFGSGGPEGGGLSEATILDIRKRLADKQASTSADKDMRSRLLQGVNPDEAASAIDLAAKSGVNRLQVEVNPETYKRADTMRQIDQLRTTAPKLRAWLDYNPENLDVSHDDVDNLSWWETAGRMAYNTPGALWASVVGSGESTLGVTQMGVDAADEMARSPSPALAAIFGNSKEATRIARDLNARAVGGTLPQDPNSPLAMASKALNAPRMSLREYKNAVTPKGSSDLESGYYSGIVSLGQNAPLIIATALTKNAAFMTVGMTASTAGEAYSRATDEHPELSYSQRAAYALTQAGIEFITEAGPNALFVEALMKGSIKDQIIGFGMQQVSEQLGEQAATALQDLNDWLTLKPEATWEDYLKERPSAALQTFVATLVAGGGQVAIGKAADAAGQKIDAQNQQKRAEDLAGFVRALGDNAKDSKLLKRMPEKWREAVAHVTKDGPKENVLISPVGIEELAQTVGVKPEQLATALRIDPAKMAADMDAGEYVSVPIGDYAAMIQTAKKDAGVSGEQIYAALEQHIKFDDKEMTGAEHKVLREEFDKAMTLEADMEAGTDFADKAARVLNDARSRINALGRYNADTSATESLVVAKLIVNVAQRENLDPEALWNQYGSQYNNAGGVGPTTGELPQSYRRPAEPIGDNELEYAAADLTPLEFEAWKGAREGLSNEEITDRINEAEPDAVYTTDKIKEAISRARGRGFDSESAQTSFYNRGKDAKTLRLIDLRAKGVKNAQIAEALYPDVPTDAALNRVKALASKNKAKIEERKAELAAKAGQKELAQTKAAGFSGMNLFEQNIINLYAKAQLDSLVHEHAHFYLKVLEHMHRTSETPLPFVVSQLAAIRSAFGKNQEFDIYDANGQITAEGIEVQELFAESFGVWFMTGKAPSAEMRSMFATIKQWMLDIYKAVKNGIRNAIINDGNPYLKNRIAAAEGRRGKSFTNEELVEFVIPEELREVFDRALASDEAIEAATKKITVDATKLAQAMLDKKVITQRQFEKAKERLLAAKLQAQDEMRARMIDEYIRSKRAPWREEERELEKDFFSEVDERPNQRHYQVMSGEGWRDTLEDHVADLAAQAQVMENAQQAGYKGMNLEEAADWIAAREKGLDLSAEVRHERAKEQGFTARFWHETQTGTQVITSGFDLSKRLASTGDHIMPIGVFMKPGKGGIGIGGDQLELLVRLGNTQTFADRTELEAHLRQDAEYAKLADEVASIDAEQNARYTALDASWRQTKDGSPEYYALNAQLRQAALERDEAIAVAAEAARVRATAVFKEQGVNSLTIGKDTGSATRPVKTTIVLDTRDIRSVDAAFDPDNAQRSGMLAHSGGSKQTLPMDEASRMGRARAQGFDVDTKLYHGSPNLGIDAFDPKRAGTNFNKDTEGVYFTTNRRAAETYAGSKDYGVSEVNIKPGRQLTVDWGGRGWDQPSGKFKSTDDLVRKAKKEGYDSVRINNVLDVARHIEDGAGDTVVVFDPKNILKTNTKPQSAAFDPSQSGSSKLLAHTVETAAAISDAYADSLQYTVMDATDESLAGLRQQMINDGVVPVILLFKSTTGRIIAFPGGSEAVGLHHDQAREVLGLGDLKLQHGVYNPRKWVSLSDMAGPDAWYDTTGMASEGQNELAQSQTHAPKGERELDALFHTRTSKGRTAQPAAIPAMRLNLQIVKEVFGEEALAALPPKVRAYSTNATDADDFLREGRAALKTANKPRPKSLWKFLSTQRAVGSVKYSGIRDPDGEILKIIGEKKAARGLIASAEDTKFGRSYDIEQAAEAAWEAGYFTSESPPTPTEFLDALRADIDGQAKLYAADDMEKVAQIDSAQQWVDWFDENEIDLNEKNDALLQAQIAVRLSGTNENAVGPDEAAQIFNAHFKKQVFKDGKDFLDSLQEGTKRNQIVRDLVKAEMIKRHGDIFADGTVMQEAEAYARNQILERQDEIELEALANAVGQQAAANMTREMAKERLRDKQVREVLNYHQWLTLEQRWMAKAVKAAEDGNMAKALEFKRLAMINRAMFTEGKKLAEKIEKDVTFFKSFEKKDKRAKLAKAGMDYLDQMDQLLENIELRKRPEKLLRERATLAEWFAQKQGQIDPLLDRSGMSEDERMAAELEEIERSDALAAIQQDAQLRNYKSLTVEELSAVRDQADMIALAARRAGALMVDGERRLLNLAIDDIEAQAIIAQPKELPPESFASYAPKEKGERENKEFFAELRTMQSIILTIDGMDGGPLAQNTTHKLNTAIANGLARLRVEEDRVVALYRAAYGIDVDVLRKDQVNIPGIPVPMAKMERLTVALYMGTEISRKRMRDGYGWSDATLQSIINTLDQKDWAFVTSMWEYVNSLYPEAAEAHLDVHGIPLTKQPGLPIVTRFGVIQGNYFPIAYDPHKSSRADQQALTETAKQITGRAGTRKATSSTKERVKGKVMMPVLLDFSVTLGKHVNEVVGNITTQKAILDAGRIIAHPRTQKIIVSRHGWVKYKALMSAMKDTRNGLAAPNGPTERIAARVRNGATNTALGLNIGTVIKQLLGYTSSIVRLGDQKTGPIAGAGWLIRGMVRMGFGAKGMQNGVSFILQRSSYMGVRMQVMNQAIAEQQRRINNGRIKADIKRGIDIASFFMLQRLQFLAVDSPTWLGAYDKFIAGGMTEKNASASADQVVIDAQGSGEIFQTSAFQRGSPMQRIFTNFLTAAIANWNVASNVTERTNFRNPGQALIWAMNIGVLMVVPVIGGMAVNAIMSPGGDDDEPLEEKYARAQIAFLISPLGLVGQLSGAVVGFSYNGPQGTRFFEEASKVITEAFTGAERVLEGAATTKDAVDILRPANMAAGVWFGYPAAALDKFVRGAEAMISGKTEDPKALIAGPPRE